MKKKRHIKTFPEKYSNDDVFDEAAVAASLEYGKLDSEEIFNKLPYIGYLRIDVLNCDTNSWWYDTNSEGQIRAKILVVDDKVVKYCHYDSHHHQISWMTKEHEGIAVEGNALIKL